MVLKLPREQKSTLISHIQEFFELERGESIGELAAENLLEFMLKQLGPILYNQALGDARNVILQEMERIEEEIYGLEQPVARVKDGD